MRYMFLIYGNEETREQIAPEAEQKAIAGHWAVMDEATRRGIFRGAEPLHLTSTATTVRTKNGIVLTTDGPFAETKEQLAGYYILDCKDLDEAIAWAAKIPNCCGGDEGCIEIRPLRALSRPESEAAQAQYANVNG
jgi:hypothetical protein